jgi:hypothetical protein
LGQRIQETRELRLERIQELHDFLVGVSGSTEKLCFQKTLNNPKPALMCKMVGLGKKTEQKLKTLC